MRVSAGPHTRRRQKKTLDLAKGFTSRQKSCLKFAHEQVMRKLKHAYRHRKRKKGDMRALWIVRINAAVRMIDADYSYSQFMHGLKVANITVDRKMLAELAVNDNQEFGNLVKLAKAAAV